MKIYCALTRLEYKEDIGEFLKCKVHLCARGDQQISGLSFKESDPCVSVRKARLLLEFVAANGAKVIKNNMLLSYSFGDIGDDVVYTLQPDNHVKAVVAD